MVVVGITVAVVLGCASLGVLVVCRWYRLLRELERSVEALGRGKGARPIFAPMTWPFGRLVRSFDEAVPQLENRITKLEQDRKQLAAVLSGMAEGVVAIDARQRLLFVNASAERMFGIPPGAVGRMLHEVIRSPHVQQVVEATLAELEPYRGEIRIAGRESAPRGNARVLSVQGTPLTGTPPEGAVFVFHDVTELRRLEGIRQDFVANVSHELKTPLASIKAYTETLLDWALHDEKVNVRFLHQIEDQADRLNQLILDLLSLARLESGQNVYDHRPLVLSPVISQCVEAHRGRAESKQQSFQLDLGTIDEETLVVADDEAIRQILDNLVDNAIKYTPEGGSVRVSCYVEKESVVIDVTDTGIGIPRDDLPRVFERFYRVDKARSRELGGTGLGLSIVKHLVQSIGGQVKVHSRLGSGSRFSVSLPRHLIPAART